MFRSRGLRLSLIGAVIFAMSIIALALLPDLVPIVGVLIGGTLVWAGFLWTIFSYYQPSR